MFCEKCGNKLLEGAKFCGNCGTTVKAASAAPPPPPQQQQQQFAPPPPPTYAPAGAAVMTIGQYLGMLILSAIPIVGFILILVWSFSSSTNPNKKNYARAMLILAAIGLVFSIIFGAALAAMISSLFDSLGGLY